MVVLALVYLVLGFLADDARGVSPLAILPLSAIFLGEFGLRLWDAPSRLGHLWHHWVDLVSSIPLVGGLRSVRLLRLLRLGAALRLVSVVEHGAEVRGRGRDSLWYLAPCLFVLWVCAAAGYWGLEHGSNPHVHDFGDALYWAFITATTVGYGDVTPVTPEGRVLAGLVIFTGIGLVGFASARITQSLLRHDDGSAALHGRMAAMEERLEQMHLMVRALHQHLETGPPATATSGPTTHAEVTTNPGGAA